jgi:hypothetical protein
MERDGRPNEYRVDHIYEIQNGRFTSFVERAGNEDEFNRVWG